MELLNYLYEKVSTLEAMVKIQSDRIENLKETINLQSEMMKIQNEIIKNLKGQGGL